MSAGVAPILSARGVGKRFGSVVALENVDCEVHAGEVTAVLGDNGAGKSTLISLLSGMHQPDSGQIRIDGQPVRLASPRQAKALGIETVYQDLALAPLMPVWRNFFLGEELTRFGLIRRKESRATAAAALKEFGIHLRDADQAVGTLSGGERQCVAIARAVHFGARALILDEPTAALGVRQSGIVLRQIALARERGLGVVFITHNPAHAVAVADRFVVLARGTVGKQALRGEIGLDELALDMSGGRELEEITEEIASMRGGDRAQ